MSVTEIHQAKDADNVLNAAKGQYDDICIIGYKDGVMDVRSNLTHKDVLWLLEMFKHKMMHGDYGD